MGRRAKKAPVQTKKRPTLAKQFKCPFCANDNVVECKMDFRNGVGKLECRLCGASYQMPIHHLHEPIDVFSEWLDDCEAAQRPAAEQPQQYLEDDEDEEDDDDIPEASGLGQQPAAAAAAKKSEESNEGPSYSALGLDDSDEDDEEEEDDDE